MTNQTATMLIQTTDGYREASTKVLQSTDVKEVVAHAKKGGLTAGFAVLYAVHPENKQVLCVMKTGYFNQRDVRTLTEHGFSEFHFSWAWAGKTWRFSDGTEVQARDVDLFKGVKA